MRKKITVLLLQISLALMCVLVLIDGVGATKKDAERALDLLRRARAAIGGDAVIQSVQNLSVKGNTRRIVKTQDKTDKELNGEFEVALIMPDKILRMERFGIPNGPEGGFFNEDDSETIKSNNIKVNKIFRREENSDERMTQQHHHGSNELVRFTLGFLLSTPKNANLSYDYIGEETVEGRSANVIAIQNQTGPVMRLYLDAQSSLPLMISYKGFVPPVPPLPSIDKRVEAANGDVLVEDKDVIILKAPQEGEQTKADRRLKVKVMTKEGASIVGEPKKFTAFVEKPVEADVQVRFGDYRSVNGVLLPFQMTQYVNGAIDQNMSVENYEINSSKTEEMFKTGPVRVIKHKRQ